MEPVEPQTTEVIEEKPEPRRTRKNHWAFAGGVLVVVMLVVLVLFMLRVTKDATSMLSPNDLTQQKYDLQEREREKNMASQLRDDPLLLRKDSESET
jgi:nitrate/nitrite transporter NarK